MNQEDEQLIWKYLDGRANAEESSSLFERAKIDTELDSALKWANQVDSLMMSAKRDTVSPELRLKILQEISSQEKIQRSSQRWMNPGLRLFALFNLGVLLFSLLFSYVAPTYTTSDHMIDTWITFLQLLKTPFAQTILMLSTGIFLLLMFDQWLRRQGQRRLTTPV